MQGIYEAVAGDRQFGALKVYNDTSMTKAAEIFGEAAPVITQIKQIIVDYLINKYDGTDELPALFTLAARTMKSGFEASFICLRLRIRFWF